MVYQSIICSWTSVGIILASMALIPISECAYVSRSEWGARVRKGNNTTLATPVPYVVIHHSFLPGACHSLRDCSAAMRSMQDFHMEDRGWDDIGYNFAVGGDGSVYEGRGFTTLGAHSLHFNTVSIGIVLIGDWTDILPPKLQMKAAKLLISSGVKLGYIKPNYKLVGHRQVRDTECPGNALFNEIKTWKHWSKHPASAVELIHVKELPDSIRNQLSS